MHIKNYMTVKFSAESINESFSRSVIGCFCLRLNPSVSELTDIKTAVSEAVTNCIVHGYPKRDGEITMYAEIIDDYIHIEISDNGIGIEDVEKAREPFFTTKTDDERSGMGFTIMQSFMDEVIVKSEINKGTVVKMKKHIKSDV